MEWSKKALLVGGTAAAALAVLYLLKVENGNQLGSSNLGCDGLILKIVLIPVDVLLLANF